MQRAALFLAIVAMAFALACGIGPMPDEDGNPVKGEYARAFEEEYQRLAAHPDYVSLFQEAGFAADADAVHDGYFSIDKKGGWTDTAENNQVNRDNAQRAYNLIMKEKEKLLSLDEPLKFIFSHSALREGWDNPNVFQICALRDIQTERERRQTIGRGLRLCVNQKGERRRGFEVNTLTVIARESYEEFAEDLQREIERDTGIRFGVVELKADSLVVPQRFADQRAEIVAVLRKLAGRFKIQNADERQTVRPRQAVLDSGEFRGLWDRIKHKTTYRVAFNNERLVKACAVALRQAPAIPRTRLLWRKADIAIGKAGVEAMEVAGDAPVPLDEPDIELPDILTELQDRTRLTRRSIHRILVGSRRLLDFRRNPQQFIEYAAMAINRCKRRALVDGIKYRRIGDESYYAQELFEQEELTGYLRNMLEAGKSVYDKVVYESDTEARFADQLERNSAVTLYTKLPGWFTVPTPLGGYNPDWAVLITSDVGERLYLVVETKGSSQPGDLRFTEADKIACGRAHFEAIAVRESPAQYEVTPSLDELLARIGGRQPPSDPPSSPQAARKRSDGSNHASSVDSPLVRNYKPESQGSPTT